MSPHPVRDHALFEHGKLLLEHLVFLLQFLHEGDGIGQDLRLLQRRRAPLGGLLDSAAHRLLQGNELGVHVRAVPLLDDVVRRPLRRIAAGGGLGLTRAGVGVAGETTGGLAGGVVGGRGGGGGRG